MKHITGEGSFQVHASIHVHVHFLMCIHGPICTCSNTSDMYVYMYINNHIIPSSIYSVSFGTLCMCRIMSTFQMYCTHIIREYACLC